MIYVLPLEVLEERYTEQWYRWYAEKFAEAGVEYQYIPGEQLTTSVETGVVLDAEGTNYWKFSQLLKVCKLFKEGKVKDGDVFFTMDLWHPGLEAIPYMATLEKIDVKIFGFLHAGSFTNEDFAEPMAPWAQYFERGWANICDGIFMGTEYGKRKFYNTRLWDLDDAKLGEEPKPLTKIHVTGYPANKTEAFKRAEIDQLKLPQYRENIIVYPHRFDIEKRPDVFMEMMEQLWSIRQDFKVIFTTSRPEFRTNELKLIEQLDRSSFDFEFKIGLTKGEYYRVLSESKIFVSTTIEEFFGLCLFEAMMFGCIPVVPDKFSHPELLRNRSEFMYREYNEAVQMIDSYLDQSPDISYFPEAVAHYEKSIGRMIGIMT